MSEGEVTLGNHYLFCKCLIVGQGVTFFLKLKYFIHERGIILNQKAVRDMQDWVRKRVLYILDAWTSLVVSKSDHGQSGGSRNQWPHHFPDSYFLFSWCHVEGAQSVSESVVGSIESQIRAASRLGNYIVASCLSLFAGLMQTWPASFHVTIPKVTKCGLRRSFEKCKGWNTSKIGTQHIRNKYYYPSWSMQKDGQSAGHSFPVSCFVIMYMAKEPNATDSLKGILIKPTYI